MKIKLIFLFLLYFPLTIYAQEGIMISELYLASPKSEGSYVELYNFSGNCIDLNGWKLQGNGSSSFFELTGSVIIPANSAFLIVYKDQKSNFRLSSLFPQIQEKESSLVLYQSGIDFGNSGAYVKLINKEGQLMDSVYYATSYPNKEGISQKSPVQFLSLTRNKAVINLLGYVNINNSDFNQGKASPLSVEVSTPIINKAEYEYDNAGNRIAKHIPTITLASSDSGEKENVTSIDQRISSHEIQIYPNPTQGNILVQINSLLDTDEGEISIFSSNGALIENKKIETFQVNFNLTHEPKGLYLMTIFLNGQQTNVKILKK